MNNKTLISLLLLLVVSVSCAPVVTTQAPQVPEYRVLENVPVPMRDGVNLMANIFQPAEEGKYPVIVMRTPYGKGNAKDGYGRSFAKNGYIYVVQDCQGAFGRGMVPRHKRKKRWV